MPWHGQICKLKSRLPAHQREMTAFVADDDYPFDLGVENGAHKTIGLMEFSNTTNDTTERFNTILRWLNRGIVWYYAFNHEEAIVCFQKVLDIDDRNTMAHYGISVCHGPNYNTETMSRDAFPSAKDAYEHAQTALRLIKDPAIRSKLSDIEISIVEALECRFNPLSEVDDGEPIEANTEAYAASLKLVYERYPNHATVGCLYAEALLNISPWCLWDLNTGEPKPHAVTAKSVIEKALQVAPNHPGLNHFMIHLMEMSPTPEASLPSCAVLRRLFPSAGHLIHMPSHIYVLLGMWQEAADANVEASVADDQYVVKEGIYNYYTGYRIHNLHFIAYAAMFAGQFEPAMKAARDVNKNLPDKLLSNPIMNKFFESFLSIEWHVLVRFGKWQDIFDKPSPTDIKLHPYSTATSYYAKGIGHAVTGDTRKAKEYLEKLKIATPLVPEEHVLHNNLCTDLLMIAEHMLTGELMYRECECEQAFWELEMAAKLSDELVYDEPWGWMQPPGHALGALSLEQGRVAAAEKWFRKDMDKQCYGRCHPDNIWALSGLQSCLIQKQKQQKQQQQQQQQQEQQQGSVDEIDLELAEIRMKLDALKSKAGCTEVKVACMCATKSR